MQTLLQQSAFFTQRARKAPQLPPSLLRHLLVVVEQAWLQHSAEVAQNTPAGRQKPPSKVGKVQVLETRSQSKLQHWLKDVQLAPRAKQAPPSVPCG